jgi:hypothetical protein
VVERIGRIDAGAHQEAAEVDGDEENAKAKDEASMESSETDETVAEEPDDDLAAAQLAILDDPAFQRKLGEEIERRAEEMVRDMKAAAPPTAPTPKARRPTPRRRHRRYPSRPRRDRVRGSRRSPT